MAKFHLDKSGNPAPCNATVRACPLGGEHFDSMKDAMFASAQQARREAFNADSPMTYPPRSDNFDEFTNVVREEEFLSRLDELSHAKLLEFLYAEDRKISDADGDMSAGRPEHAVDEIARRLEEGSLSDRQRMADELCAQPFTNGGHVADAFEEGLNKVFQDGGRHWRTDTMYDLEGYDRDGYDEEGIDRNGEYRDAFADPFWDDYEDPFADPLEDLASQNEWRMDDDVDDEDFDDFAALQEAYSGLPDDPEGQDDFARSKLRESIAENKEFFNSSAPELVIYAIDDRVSKQVAAVFDNPSGRKKLMELVTHLETTLSKDKTRAQQAGTYVANEWAQQEAQLTAMKHLLSPRSGHRRSTGSTKRDIDPELIQALRFMYLKKYGVDPFEANVSVSELLAMLKSGELR